MRLIVHPGLPKAGSTSIQMLLREHSDHLREQGIAYLEPTLVNDAPPVHQQILDAVRVFRIHDDVTDVVASHEDLIALNRRDHSSFMSELRDSGVEVKVVTVVRPFADWIVSKEKHRARSLTGAVVHTSPPVWNWMRVWFGPKAVPLMADARIIDLHAERGLLPEFVSATGLPIPEQWVADAPAVNRSGTSQDFAAFLVINRAIAVVLELAPDSKAVMRDAGFRESRKWLRLLLNEGDHHRNPRAMAMPADLRTDLLNHFVDDMWSSLGRLVDDQAVNKELRWLRRECRLLLSGEVALAKAWEDEFLSALEPGIAPAEDQLQAVCDKNGFSEIARIMLPD